MSKFTKGKWSICMDGSIEITDENGEFVMAINDITGAEDNDEEIDANLRLIAAAPEMYEELNFAINALRGGNAYDRKRADEIEALLDRIDGKEV